MTTNEAEVVGRQMLKEGSTTDEVLSEWRRGGLSILHSIQCWSHISGMDLSKSKEIVHSSPTWADLRSDYDGFHEELEKIATKE